jgi:glycosyltransferase involved in cell wall biosynthesis
MLADRDRMIAVRGRRRHHRARTDDLLAQPVLESMAVGTPVLASARNASAVAHCRRANAGLFYENREEFVEAMRLMATEPRPARADGRRRPPATSNSTTAGTP